MGAIPDRCSLGAFFDQQFCRFPLGPSFVHWDEVRGQGLKCEELTSSARSRHQDSDEKENLHTVSPPAVGS